MSLSDAAAASCMCIPDVRYGHRHSHWIADWFSDCVYGPLDTVAFALGWVSLALFAVSLMPQIWANYRNRSVEGLSVGFILFWLFGDIFNVIGCVLGRQLPTQLYTGIYFVIVGGSLFVQWVYYHGLDEEARERSPAPVNLPYKLLLEHDVTTSLAAVVAVVPLIALHLHYNYGDHSYGASMASSRVLLAIRNCLPDPAVFKSPIEIVLGCIFSWSSGLLYLFARLPQVIQNNYRQSVDGLSPLMFLTTVTANITYTLSILLRFPDIYSQKFLLDTLPFIVGSVGTILFDACILYQFFLFGEK